MYDCVCVCIDVHVSWKVEKTIYPIVEYHQPLVLCNNVGFSEHVICPGKNYTNPQLWYLICSVIP